MSDYLLITPSEDGEPCHFIDSDELADVQEGWGVKRWLTAVPDLDPMYWRDGDALLLRYDIVQPPTVGGLSDVD